MGLLRVRRTISPICAGLFAVCASSPALSTATEMTPPEIRCTAVTRGSVHLRPKAQRKSAGPEFPKGTALTVMAQLPPPEKGDDRPIYQVKVTSSGATGYLYLRPSELGKSCPLVWPGREDQKAAEVATAEGTCLKAGPAKGIAALYGKGCDSGPHPSKEDKELDVNADGRPDWVVMAQGDQRELGVLLNTPAGYRGLRLASGDSKIWDLSGVVQAGPAVYIILQDTNWENFHNDAGEVEQGGSSTFTFFRVMGDGRAYRVFVLSSDDKDEACTYRGKPDQSVTLECHGRAQKLRWDAAAKVLRPTLDPP